MPLYYLCKMCGQEHEAPIRFADKKCFDNSIMTGNNVFRCPEGRKTAGYIKSELFWKDN